MDIDDLTTQSTLPAYIELFDIDLEYPVATLNNVALQQIDGMFACTADQRISVGKQVQVTGTFTGTANVPAFSSSSLFYIVYVFFMGDNTLFKLASTENGTPITSTQGTLTGLTFTLMNKLSYKLTPEVGDNAPIVFGGDTYTPFPIQLTSYSQNSDGAPARPSLAISNVNKVFGMLTFTMQDIIGAKVTYYRTFATYLNQATKISAAPLKFTIARKTQHNMSNLVFELRSPLDSDRGYLPKRQMLKREFPGLGINKIIQ